MKHLSIKTRVTLFATAGYLLLLFVVSLLLLQYVRFDMKRLLGDQQLTLVRTVAEGIDQRIAGTHRALMAVAASITPETVASTAALQSFLGRQTALLSMFEGVFVTSRDGVTLLDLPAMGRQGLNVADLEYFQRTVREKRPIVSEPFWTRLRQQPAIAMTAPIRGPDGEIVGVLFGSVNLLHSSFLADIADARVGQSGAFALLERNRTIVVSRDKSRILTAGPAPGVSPYFDHAMTQSEGSEEGFNSRGLHAMFSYKVLRTVPWVLVAALPAEEAFAPIDRAESRIVLVTVLFALLIAPVVWFGARHTLRPLLALRDAIRRNQSQPGEIYPSGIQGGDEFGDLAGEFDAMVRARHEADQAQRESESRLRMLVDSVRDYSIFMLDEEGRITSWNEGAERMLGYRAEQAQGRHLSCFYTSQEIDSGAPERALRAARETGRSEDESWRVRWDGSRFWANVIISRLATRERVAPGFAVVTRDLTDRREARAAVAEREARLHAFVEHSPSPMFVKDLEGRYLQVNSQFLRCYGLEMKAVIGRRDEDLFRPEVARAFVTNDRRVVASGAPVEVEEGAWYTDGWHTSIVTKFPLVDAAGSITGIAGIVTDITERRNAERGLQISERRLRTITENMPAMIAYVDSQERYRFVNPTVERWFGVAIGAYIGRTVREMRGEEWYAAYGSYVRRALAGESVSFDYQRFDGRAQRSLDVKCIPDVNDEGRCEGFYLLINDISAIKDAERTLRESEARLRAIGDASPLGVFVTDREGFTTYTNVRYREVSGAHDDGAGPGWLEIVHAGERSSAAEAWQETVRSGHAYAGEHRCRREDGTMAWIQVRANPFFEQGKTVGFVGTIEDITQRKEAERQLIRRAHIDSLTGLPNRSLFNDRLATALLRRTRSGRPIALLYLDVDGFKSMNDRHGHAVGDAVLTAFGERLMRTVRSADTVARLGGDEFAVILEEIHGPEDACLVAQKIIDAMQQPLVAGQQAFTVTTSIGVACSTDADAATSLAQADRALYAAKRAGRNRFELAPPAGDNVIPLPFPGRSQ